MVVSLVWLAASVSGWAATRQTLRTHVPAEVTRLQPVGRMQRTTRLDLTIGLPLRNQGALTNLLRELYDPASRQYHQYLTPEQFAEQFGPTEQDYRAVMAFANANGLEVTGTHANRTLVEVNGSAADIERAFHVNLRVYRHPTEGRTFHAPDREPSVDLGVPLLGVNGLDDFVLPKPMDLRTNGFRAMSSDATNGTPFAAGSGPRGAYIGRDFRAAYAPGVALQGTGQTVGLFELDGYYATDIAAYENLAGLPNVVLTNVVPSAPGSPGLAPGANNIEVALDIDMTISMAPGVSRVIVYEGFVPLNLLNRMATDNLARELSCSWSFGADVDPVRDQIFLQFAAQGQTMFQSSGDNGAYAGGTPSLTDNPYLTVVGGTSLTVNPAGGAWSGETVWPGSGGGVSTNYTIPGWQQGLATPANGGSTTMRNLPDVACLADETIWIIGNDGQQGVVGGTSASAPLWAGFTALINQQAAMNGQRSVGFLNPAIYMLARSTGYGTAFHDIATGNNTNSSSPTNFFATPGYDLCTGWGTPTGSNLITALAAQPAPLQIAPGANVVFTGPPGGPFSPGSQSYQLSNVGLTNLNWAVGKNAMWLKISPTNGALATGGPATNVTITLNALANGFGTGSYPVTLSFTNLNDQSVQNRLVILSVVGPPVITLQPGSEVVIQGQTASFAVGTATNGVLAYQWQFDNGTYETNLSDGGNISGSETSTLTISNAGPANLGAYSVVVSNAVGAVTSSNAFLAIVPWRATIVTQPMGQNVLPGQAVTLNVGAVGSQPLAYQWLRNGVNLTDGGNVQGSATATLNIGNIAQSNAGTYSVIVSNSLGSAISAGALLSVATNTSAGVGLAAIYSFSGGNDGGQPNGLAQGADGNFYATTVNGGTNFSGSVFAMTPGGSLMNLYSFSGGNDGASPFSTLLAGPSGNFYGTTFQGGTNDNGTVFSVTSNGILNTLVQFNGANGDLPYAGLSAGPGGNLFGTTYQGGGIGFGTAFEMSTNGALSTLYSFGGKGDGGLPYAGVVQGGDGNLYGTTFQGGLYGAGGVFRATTSGTLTNLVSFNGTNGASAYGGLCQALDGSLYGTTYLGGATGNGTVFRMTTAGVLTNLYSFRGGADGGNPTAGLILGSDGNFYGTTTFGGTYGEGTIFRLAPGGTPATLAAFDGFDGANPLAPLTQGADGNVYGTTSRGGASGQGVVFRLSATGSPQITSQPSSQSVFVGANVVFSVAAFGAPSLSFHWLENGTNLADGGNVSGSGARILMLTNVTLANSGGYAVVVSNLLGAMTSSVAALQVNSSAPIFITQPTNQTVVPGAMVAMVANVVGNLPLIYRWTLNGIKLNDSGNVSGAATSTLMIADAVEANNGTYALSVSNTLGSAPSSNAMLAVTPPSAPGTLMATLHAFANGGDGGSPNGLTAGSDGNIYGTTEVGPIGHGFGTAFRVTPGGALTTLTTFTGVNGASPGVALDEGSDGNFYGTTQDGGTNSTGNIFRMTPDGTLTNLYSFAGEQGVGNPISSLIQGTDGDFYGTMLVGGAQGVGSAFKMAPDGTLTNLYSFQGGSDGSFPGGALVQASDGNFYGMTPAGSLTNGSIFRMTPAGAVSAIYSFTGGTDGYSPAGALAQGSDGYLYGTTTHNILSGFQFYGTIFKVSTNGAFTTLYTLNFSDGSYPHAGLIQGSDGNFYGTAYQGGATGAGAVFRITPGGAFTTLLSFDGFDDGSNPTAAVVEGADGAIYGTTTTGGPGGHGTVFRLSFTSAPQITSQPASHTTYAGANVILGVAVSGAPTLSYQWQLNSTNLSDGGNLAGAATRVLALTNVTAANNGTYSVTITNALGSTNSTGATLTVLPFAQPSFTTVARNKNGRIAMTWSAVSGLSYQLQSSPDLLSWTNLNSPITASASTVSATDTIVGRPQHYYRVLLLP
jgi:uncharacterized repeat protein (TIGR03803 family)